MSLSKTLKFFAVLVWVLLMAFPMQANTNPRNTGKTSEQNISPEALQNQYQDEQESQEKISEEDDQEDQQQLDSNSSLNYIFYIIYKVKFEDLFRFPDRSGSQNSVGLKLININSLLEYLNNPKI
jgi:hypothetical protein